MLRHSVAFDKIAELISPYFRSRRMNQFLAEFSPTEKTSILDVGGHPMFWKDSPVRSRITIINSSILELTSPDHGRFELLAGDARSLPFPDKAFDIGFSNSVIEHLSNWREQQRAARELERVCNHIWVQTPARWFPIETHLKTPLVHYLPVKVQRKVIRHFTVWGLMSRPAKEDIDAFLDEIALLTYKDMQALFSDCKIMRESLLFLTKSYVAIK